MSIAAQRPFRVLGVAALSCVLLTLGGCVFGQVHLERETRLLTVDHVAASPVSVRTINGAVSVVADTSASDVSVTAELRAQSLDRLERTKIVASRDPDGTLRIDIAWADGVALNSEGCDLDIILPDARGVDIHTSNGSVEVSNLAGKATLNSSNGRITATHHDGDVVASTSNGSISVTDPAGDVEADSSNGAITVANAPGRVSADSSNGKIDIRLASTSAGPVIADTANGSINLVVGASFRGRLSLRTSNSGITTEGFSSRSDAKVEKSSKSKATIVFGEGGADSTCSTSNGHITVATR